MARESDSNPFLQGNFGPWRGETAAGDLEVLGEIPRDLNGVYYRNGPNPAFEPLGRYHWFDGDGMIHAITLQDGRASYRNRYVMSAGLRAEQTAGKALFNGLLDISPTEAPAFKNTGNTNIVFHAGKLLALMEGALPTQMQPGTLATIGEYDFGGKLAGAMTAHPKMDRETGEMLFFGYSPFPPHLQYYLVGADGALVRSEVIDVAWPSMMHDFATTRDFVIFILCPLVFRFENLAETGSVFSWEPERGTRIGVMPRNGGNADVRWFETEASYVFHPMNAYAENGALVLDVARYGRMRFMSPDTPWDNDSAQDAPILHRWHIDLRSGTIRSEARDDRAAEFPRIDDRRLGLRHRFGYMAAQGPENIAYKAPLFTAIHRYDLDRGTREVRAFGPYNGVGEPLFVPRRADAAEDDGYVIVLGYTAAADRSDFYVFDARNIAGEPIATVRLPHRVPYGFHGNWVAATA